MTSSTLPKTPSGPKRPTSPPASTPRPGGILPRMGMQAIEVMVGMRDQAVRIDLRLIGAPLYDLIDIQVVDFDPHDIEPFIKALETNREQAHHLRQQADAYWESLSWKGAILVYNWSEAGESALKARLELNEKEPMVVRVTDPLLALNLLGRARGMLLLPRASLVLERAFISRAVFSDDSRLIQMALAAGCTFSPLIDPLPEPEETVAEDEIA